MSVISNYVPFTSQYCLNLLLNTMKNIVYVNNIVVLLIDNETHVRTHARTHTLESAKERTSEHFGISYIPDPELIKCAHARAHI